MNYAVLKHSIATGGVFWTGFLFGAHKYHLLYYLPPLLNPQLRCVKPWWVYSDELKELARRETYYAEVQRKMSECE